MKTSRYGGSPTFSTLSADFSPWRSAKAVIRQVSIQRNSNVRCGRTAVYEGAARVVRPARLIQVDGSVRRSQQRRSFAGSSCGGGGGSQLSTTARMKVISLSGVKLGGYPVDSRFRVDPFQCVHTEKTEAIWSNVRKLNVIPHKTAAIKIAMRQ